MPESDAVLAFIRERQVEVLSRAIAEIEQSSEDDLTAAVHAAKGTVGSYQLDDAFAVIARLWEVVSDPTADGAARLAARSSSVIELRDIEKSISA